MVVISALLVGSVASPARAESTAVLDQSATVLSSDQSRAANFNDWPTQLFTPSTSGLLTRLDLALGRSSDRVNGYHVDIFPMNRDGELQSDPVYGNPNDLEPVQIPASSVSAEAPSMSTYQWTTINLERPVVLVGGQKYLVRLVQEDGDGSFSWFTSSSAYSRGGARDGDGNSIWADDNEEVPLQYGFKTWMNQSVFSNSGTWQASSIASTEPIICEGDSRYCPSFTDLSTNFDGSDVFGVSSYSDATIHSSDSGANYSSARTTRPISDGGVAGTSMYANGEGVLLSRFCNLWMSIDGGTTFSRITAVDFGRGDNACFKQAVATQDGQVMAAVASGAAFYDKHQGIYVSTDAGVTWTETLSDHPWTSIAMNADGSKMIVVASDFTVMISTDSGASWSNLPVEPLNTGRWNSVAMAANGASAFLSDNHNLFKVNLLTGEVNKFGHEDLWKKVQISSDGQIVAALDDSGHIFVSRDAGVTIGQAGDGNILFEDIAMSSGGLLLHASAAGAMYHIDPTTIDSTVTSIVDPSPSPSPKPASHGTKTKSKRSAVQFASSTSVLTSSVKKSIKRTVTKAGKNANYVITGSAGQTSGVSVKFVRALAKNRALAVKSYLVKLGVQRSHITIKIKIVKQGVTPKTRILAKYLVL